jgi:CHRD domain
MHLKSAISALSVAALIMISSCKKDNDTTPDPNIAFTATLNGANESTPNTSTATGSATATFNKDTKILTAVVNYTGITPSAAHIHKGAVGVSGGVIFGFGSAPFSNPINYVTAVPLDATQEADLMANLYYVNLHSTAIPSGEIRGQLIKQ